MTLHNIQFYRRCGSLIVHVIVSEMCNVLNHKCYVPGAEHGVLPGTEHSVLPGTELPGTEHSVLPNFKCMQSFQIQLINLSTW